MRKLNAAIIGCGVISGTHAKAIEANNDKVVLYAVCDIDEKKAVKLAQEYNCKWYTDYILMLSDKNIDFVSICTPSGMHADMAFECARYGKSVLCEKPMDITGEKLSKIVDTFNGRNDIKFAGVFQYRTYTGLKKAKKMLENKELGKIYIGDGYCKIYRSPEYYKSAGWRGTWEMDGGGCLMNQGVHSVDVLCWLMGGVKSVQGHSFTLDREIEVEDTAFAYLEFKNGGFGTFTGTTLARPGRGIRIEIICEKGRIVYEDPKTYLYTVDENGKEVVTCLDDDDKKDETNPDTSNDPAALQNKGHAWLVGDLANAIINDTDPYITADLGRHAVDVILAVYESSKTGRTIII